MRLFAYADYPFIEWRRRAYVISAAILAIGLIAVIVNLVTIGSWLKYGVDFAGGTEMRVDFANPVTPDEVRAVNPEWEIKTIGEPGESEYVIRVGSFENTADVDPTTEVRTALSERFGADQVSFGQTDGVGPRVGQELQSKALLAILISFVLTLVYLAFRFEWRFGVAAVAATAHDILITLGFIAALRMDVSVATVAAFLTIVGYSLNDTIVVFDRIRENLAKRMRGSSLIETIDTSINETLPRTVITSITTLSTCLSLYLFGGDAIRDFALVLILGIAIGTFSSIFVASPVLYNIEMKWPPETKKSSSGASSARRRATATS